MPETSSRVGAGVGAGVGLGEGAAVGRLVGGAVGGMRTSGDAMSEATYLHILHVHVHNTHAATELTVWVSDGDE